jgi:hypothetical protein
MTFLTSLTSKHPFKSYNNADIHCLLDLKNCVFCCFRYLIVTKCEVVSPPLESEIISEVKSEGTGIILKPKQENEIKSEVKSQAPGIVLRPKQEIVAKSAAQIVHEQREK